MPKKEEPVVKPAPAKSNIPTAPPTKAPLGTGLAKDTAQKIINRKKQIDEALKD